MLSHTLFVIAATLGANSTAVAQQAMPSAELVAADTPTVVTDIPQRTQVVLGSTALTRPEGELGWQMSNIFLHDFQYGMGDDFQIGLRTSVPAVYVAAFPNARWSKRLGDNLWGGLDLTAGALWPYMELEEIETVFTGRALVAGGGLTLTWVGPDLTFNAGLPVYYARYGTKEFRTQIIDKSPVTLSRVDFSNVVGVVPNAGVVYRSSESTRIHAEVHVPVGKFDSVGQVALALYGFRAFVDRAYVDITFAVPVYPGGGGLYKVMPLGIPMASFGVLWP